MPENRLLKSILADAIRFIMELHQLTQQDLANRLGVSHSRIVAYLQERELPRLQTLIKIAEMAGKTIDELLKRGGKPKVEPLSGITIGGSVKGSTIAGRDAYVDTRIVTPRKYQPKEGDLSPAHAREFKELVQKIVETEKRAKRRPSSYGAVWNALNRRMGVTYYREIPDTEFARAQAYLEQWLGRIKRLLRRADPENFRRERYKAIFARAKQLGLSKDQVDDLILARFGKSSIRELSLQELEGLYNSTMGSKKKTTRPVPTA